MKKTRLYILSIVLFFYFAAFSQIVNPLNISGLAGWYSSDSIGLINGSLVPTWNDLSGNNNHLTQSNPLNQGTLFTNQLNNKPCMRLDGLNSFYSFTDSVDFRTIIVVNKVNETSFPVFRGLFAGTLSSFGVGGYLINGKTSTTEIYQGINTGNLSKMLRNKTSVFASADFSPLNTFWIGNWEFTTNRKQTAELGRMDNSSGRNWNGDMFEIIIYNKVLSASESDNIFNYLNDKYAPPVDLGPDILVTNSFCDTTLSATKPYESYLWSSGATTPTISVNTSGKYWLRAINFFGVTSTDTILVNYPNYNKITQNIICSGSQMNWSTLLPKSDYTFLWQDALTTDSVFTINQPGNYYVKITDSFGCNITSDTVKITVDNFSATASLGPDLIQCAGNSITLASGASSLHTYLWSTGSTNDSLLITTGGQYSVIVTNTNSCVAKDTINVTIQGQAPIANFTANIGCINSIVNFTDLSIPPLGNTLTTYEWNFGDLSSATNTSTLSNPSHTYTNTGTYTVSLKVISSASCEQIIRKIIQVFPKPTVNFISSISCQNDSTAFSSLSTSVSGYSITSLNWNFGDPTSGVFNTSSLVTPRHLFGNQSNYTIKLVAINNAGCKDSLINIIAVRAQVKADFTISSPCANTATFFQDNSIVPPAPNTNTRTWNLGSGPANGLSVSKTYTSSGVYYVTLTVNSSNQCSSSITKLITIYASPTASFAIPAFCSKDTITAANISVAQSGVISSYNWKLNSLNFSSIQNPTLSISNAGSYNVRLIVTNSFGCKDSITKAILVNPLPNADFTTNPTTYYYINSPVNFIPTISNASSYFWSLSSIGTSAAQSPSATYNAEGTYTVSLNLQDLQGCKNSITKTLLVSKRFLDVAILNVNSTKDNAGFMTVQTDIANYGTIPVSQLDLSYQISDGANVKETWNGTLNPNSFFSYTFISKTATQIGSSNNISCVDVKKANGINDQNQTNNELCIVLNTNDISVSNPIPNPTNSDITLPIILNKEIDFSVSIYNSNGQIQYEEKTQRGIVGLNLITLPTANYARGCYIIKTVIDDKIFIKKFIKISNE